MSKIIKSKELKIDIKGNEINCYIEKRKRKTIGIRVNSSEEILIMCPLKVSYEYIEKVILNKTEWIEKTLLKIKKATDEKKMIEESIKEKYLFLGKEYSAEFIKERRVISFELIDDKICFYSLAKEKNNIVKKWYKKCAEDIFIKRVEYYSKIIGETPKEIKIKQLTRSWGICSSDRVVTLNWKLIMTPLDVIDYVVIHELCHLKHHNHSKQFWEEVIKYMADFKEKKMWLRDNGIKIDIIVNKIK